MPTITFESEEEFAAVYCFLHLGATLAANLHRDRSLADVVREAALDRALQAISSEDTQITPAGTKLRQLLTTPTTLTVNGETLAMVEKYVRYGAERCAPDWAIAAVVAVEVIQRSHPQMT